MTDTRRFGEVFKIIRGITFKPTDVIPPSTDNAVVCMRTKNVQVDLDESDLIGIPPSFVKREEQRLTEGDILISSANSWNLVGKCCWVPKLTYAATAGGFISILRAEPKALDARFAYHWLNSNPIQAKLRACGQKTTSISNLNFSRVKEFLVPTPTLSEQHRIAIILDKADAIRRKRRQAMDQMNDCLRSVFLEMFGDPIHGSKGWALVRMEEIARIERGKFTPRPRNDPSYYGGKYPFIQTGDITKSNGRLRAWTQTLNEKGVKVSRSFPPGTIVIAIVGATIGMTSILEIEVYCPDSVVGIQVDESKATKEYIEFLLRFWRPIFLAQAPATARANINLDTLRPLHILLPPLDLQKKFSQFCQILNTLLDRSITFEFAAANLVESLSDQIFRDSELGRHQ